jgi:hypothetical protein
MDANYFLNFRLDFIKNFYEVGSKPFAAIKYEIEEGIPPYEPPYSEDGDPPFEAAWGQADDSLNLLGGACISMLAGSLHVFLDTLVKLHGNEAAFKKTKSDNGWWGKHQNYFKTAENIDFKDSGCDMNLLEEIVLARNRVQHPGNLTGTNAQYLADDLEKVPSLFFVNDTEADIFQRLGDEQSSWLLAPTVYVDLVKLNKAIDEVRKLGSWLNQLP